MTNSSTQPSINIQDAYHPFFSNNSLPESFVNNPPNVSCLAGTASASSTMPDYSDVNGLIDYLRTHKDPSLYQQTIKDLRQRLQAPFSTLAPLPMVVARSSGGFNLIRTAEIESIVLPGGGAKGVAYVGLMRELRHGVFPHAKEFIGSSAGSLAATFMSFGDSHDEMKNMLATELPTLLDTRPELHKVYPSLRFQNTMSMIARTIWTIMGGRPLGEANGLVKKLDEVTSTAVKEYLEKTPSEELKSHIDNYCISRNIAGSEKQKLESRINALKQPADFEQNRESAMITFSDLDLLHEMDPKRFKDIQTTGYDAVTQQVHYFNVKDTPNVPVAYAARLSMSHPLLAEGVHFDPQLYASGAVYIDGGIASNLPSEVLYSHDLKRAVDAPATGEDEMTRAKIIVMKFDDSHAESGSNKGNIFTRFFTLISRRFRDWFMRFVSTNPRFEEDSQKDKEKFNAAGSNGYILHHGDLRTTEMNVSADRQEYAIDEASIGLLAQALQRKGQGYFVTVQTLQEAVDRLSDEEMRQILVAGTPTREQFGCDSAQQAYELSRGEFLAAQQDPANTEDQREKKEKAYLSAQKAFLKSEEAHMHASRLYFKVSHDPRAQRLAQKSTEEKMIEASTICEGNTPPIPSDIQQAFQTNHSFIP
ncbi:patatin-like phospholipase family protein [Pseudochelatococcus sp. G4_1912]|uniref:patatin-like phospholipase family protein n=1 Tax=Pseudochelatococcus sp. G4_1912 TaxID=3114288 RepID=UPI0039C5C0C8